MSWPVQVDEFERAAASLNKPIIVPRVMTNGMEADDCRTFSNAIDSEAHPVDFDHEATAGLRHDNDLCDKLITCDI